jgi:ankyrin repeat protein
MGKRSFSNGLFFGAGIVIGLVVILILVAPQLYLSSEDRNFANLREKSKLDCAVMPLHCLVRDENVDGIAAYVNNGKDLELTDNWGRSALFYALWNEKPGIVKLLLDAGADANTKDENERSVFFQAIAWDRYDLATMLLESGADIDLYNGTRYPETALHYCVMKNKPACVAFLLKHGADGGLQDSYGYTVFERVQMHTHIDSRIGEFLQKRKRTK